MTARLLLAAIVLAPCAPAAEGDAREHARASYERARGGDLAGAEQEMRAAITLQPGNPLYHSALAGILNREGRAAESKAEFEQSLRLDPSNAVIRSQLLAADLELGAALAKARRWGPGLELAREAAGRFPDSPAAAEMLGFFQTKTQQNVAATESYRRALTLDPDRREASVGLAIAQAAAGVDHDAMRTLEAGIRRFPDDAMHYQTLGVLLVKMEQTGRAGQMLGKALELNPDLAEAHYQLGKLALGRGDYALALEHLLAAEQRTPDDSRAHFALARLYRRMGRADEAAREMQLFQQVKDIPQ